MRPWQRALLNNPPQLDYGEVFDPAEMVGGFVQRGPSIPFSGRFPPTGPTNPSLPPSRDFPTEPARPPWIDPGPSNPSFPPAFEQLVGRKVLEKLLGIGMSRDYGQTLDRRQKILGALRPQ